MAPLIFVFISMHFLQEAKTVNLAGTMFPQALIMELCTVALVFFKCVLGVFLRHFQHETVSADLCKDAGSGNAGIYSVAAHNGLVGKQDTRGAVAVDEGKISLYGKALDCAVHGKVGCVENIHLVYFLFRGGSNGISYRTIADKVEKRLPFLFGKFLGVYSPIDSKFVLCFEEAYYFV